MSAPSKSGKPFDASRAPATDGFMSRWLVKNIEPPPRAPIKTGRDYMASSNTPVAEVMTRYLAAHQASRERIRAAAGLVRSRMSHASLAIFRFSHGAGFAIFTGHARRHLWRARQVRERPAFPQSQPRGILRLPAAFRLWGSGGMADTADSKSAGLTGREGSSPSSPTTKRIFPKTT